MEETENKTVEEQQAPLPEAEIARLKTELEAAKAQALYAQAEMVNYRRRMDNERAKWNQQSLKDVLGSLLEPRDNLERCAEALPASFDDPAKAREALSGLGEGVRMVLLQFDEALKKKGVEALDPLGKPFDPNCMEVLGNLESAEYEPGRVAKVFRKGYRVGDATIRTAVVFLAKAPSAPASEAPT